MDFTLRCNSLKCRTQLSGQAVVTTCSHIFCVPCSSKLGLSSSADNVRICPACETQLGNPDDASVTQLNPTEDYKTSVLSGLSPSIIMECASRGMAFFQYQTTQEIMYQDYMARSLTDKYATLSSQMDNVINDANVEIMALREKLSNLHLEKKNLEQKNQELANAFREKSKAQQRLQTLYQRLKSQQSATQTRNAAADDAEQMIQSMTAPQFDIYRDSGPQRPSAAQGRRSDIPQVYSHGRVGSAGSNGSGGQQQAWVGSGQGLRGDIRSQNGGAAATPAHRVGMNAPGPVMYAGRPTYSNVDHGYATIGGGNNTRQATPNRQPLGSLDQNILNDTVGNGYGLSAGARVGRLPGGQFTRNGGAPSTMGRPMPHVLHR